MTAKRFIVIDAPYENGEPFLYKKMLDKTTKKEYDNTLKGIDDICDLANKLHEENQFLKQSNEDAKHILKREFDFATEQRQKNLDDPLVVTAYDIIRYDMREALDKLGWLE